MYDLPILIYSASKLQFGVTLNMANLSNHRRSYMFNAKVVFNDDLANQPTLLKETN